MQTKPKHCQICQQCFPEAQGTCSGQLDQMLRLMDMIIIVKSYAIVENGVRDIIFSAFVTC